MSCKGRAAGAAIALLAIAALTAPALASANWTQGGKALNLGQNINTGFNKGNLVLEEKNSKILCTAGAFADIEMTGGTALGHYKHLEVQKARENCDVEGEAAVLCGKESVEKIRITKDALAQISGETIHVTELEMTVNLDDEEGHPCLFNRLTDLEFLTVTPDNAKAIKSIVWSGKANGFFGKVTVEGQMTAEASGVYGIK
jgi:hypothetical protein